MKPTEAKVYQMECERLAREDAKSVALGLRKGWGSLHQERSMKLRGCIQEAFKAWCMVVGILWERGHLCELQDVAKSTFFENVA